MAEPIFPIVLLVFLSVLGAILAAVLGWAESGEDFDPRKFLSSVGRAVLAGLLSALFFQDIAPQDVTIWICIAAFLMGAGVDVIGHRAVRAYRTFGKPG